MYILRVTMENIMQENSLDGISFENALAELEALVVKMETGKLSLDELMSGFERGQKLAGLCRNKLDNLERKISLLTRDDGKNGEWRSFEESSAPAVPENARNVSVTQEDIPF